MSTRELVLKPARGHRSNLRIGAWLMLVCACLSCFATRLQAQDESSGDAKVLFEQGIALSHDQRWAEAAEHFERSLALEDRPSTRFNLMRAYEALQRPFDVARQALAFLSLPPEPHRAEARAEVQQALDGAARKLSILTTLALPSGSELKVDGAPPALRDAARVFVLPGVHRLELRSPGAPTEVIEVELGAGQTMFWPRQGRSAEAAPRARPEPAPPAPPAPVESRSLGPLRPPTESQVEPRGEPRWRRRLAIVSGTLGAGAEATAVTLYALSLQRAHALERVDPYGLSFGSKVDGYDRVLPMVSAFAAAGGVLMAEAVAVGPRSSRWGGRVTAITGLSLGAALLGSALYLLVHQPASIENEPTSLALGRDHPTRALGSLLAGLSAPLLSYGVSFFVGMRVHRHGPDLARAGWR
jgi:hypothetical protein